MSSVYDYIVHQNHHKGFLYEEFFSKRNIALNRIRSRSVQQWNRSKLFNNKQRGSMGTEPGGSGFALARQGSEGAWGHRWRAGRGREGGGGARSHRRLIAHFGEKGAADLLARNPSLMAYARPGFATTLKALRDALGVWQPGNFPIFPFSTPKSSGFLGGCNRQHVLSRPFSWPRGNQ